MEYCLKMPVPRFFAMLVAGRRLRALDRIEECDIAMIPACMPPYFKAIRSKFEQIYLDAGGDSASLKPSMQINTSTPVLPAESKEARDFMFEIFRQKKGTL